MKDTLLEFYKQLQDTWRLKYPTIASLSQTHCLNDLYFTGDVMANKNETIFEVEFYSKYQDKHARLYPFFNYKKQIDKAEATQWLEFLKAHNCLYNNKLPVGGTDYAKYGWQPIKTILRVAKIATVD